MMLRNFLAGVFVSILSVGCAQAWPVMTNSVTVQVGEQVSADFSVPQGETRVLEARFMAGTNAVVVTNMVADYLYQTDVGLPWYTAPCTVHSGGYVRLSWGPGYDDGSPRYIGWLRLLSGSNPTYRLKFDVRMIETPGFTPNATLLARAPIDFDLLTWTNEPWWGTNDFGPADTARWTTAWSWGDHSTNGYSTGTPVYVESDPVFVAATGSMMYANTIRVRTNLAVDLSSNKYIISGFFSETGLGGAWPPGRGVANRDYNDARYAFSNQGANADTAFGWGNHATNAYVKSNAFAGFTDGGTFAGSLSAATLTSTGLATIGGVTVTPGTSGGRAQSIISPTNNANLLRIDLEPGANVAGMLIGRPGSVVPPGANGAYLCYIKAPASGTYNHALGLEAGKSNGEILHLYNKDQLHVARWNTDASEQLEVRYSLPDGADQLYFLGGSDPYMILGTGNAARVGTARLTIAGTLAVTGTASIAAGTAAGHAVTLSQLQAATGGLVTASVTNGLASVAYVDAATGAVVVTETDPIYTTALNTTNILAYRSSAGAWLFQDFEGTDGNVYVGGVDFLLAQKEVFATSNHFINLKGTVTGYPELRGRGPSLENIPWMMNGGFIATNAGAAGEGYYAMSNGVWTVFQTAELDPVWGGVSGAVVAAANNGQTAFGWGNHATAGYASTNPTYVWQGSAVVTGSHTEVVSGIASQIGTAVWLITNSATIQTGTGSVSVTSTGNYLVALSYDKLYAVNTGINPGSSVVFYEDRISDTQIIISAWCDAAGMGSYFAWVSNIVAYYYDRSGMAPQSITNDAPGIVARVDPVSDFTTDVRRVINVASLVEYVDSQENEIALHAWDYTPGGDVRPDSRMFTVDQPMVQQGQITYLQSGDYYCQSYSATEWVSTPTGSVWRIGPSGSTAFEINGTNHGLHINSFSITGATGYLVISTNYVTSTPIIEHTADLLYPQWLTVSGQTMTDATTYWLGTVPISTNRGYYRAVSLSGESRIKSYYKHQMLGGLNLSGCPTDTNGLVTGDVWNSNGFLRIYP